MLSPEPSARIAHYQLLRRIARGGMSYVYLAHDLLADQLVAIKLVDRNHGEYCERFQREICVLITLTHEHILPILDYGSYGLWHYMVMPYIEYGTLRDRLIRSPLSPEEASKILEQVADALQFAHEHGIIHRDVKPSNILLRNGEHVYVTDFGLVQHIDEESHMPQAASMLGTPAYLAPELTEHAATTRSDIYALGIVLYQMLTGQVPFQSESPMGLYWKHLSEQPQPPSMRNPALSPAIDAIVLRALEKNPQNRFETMREFTHAYQQALEVQSVWAQSIASPTVKKYKVSIRRVPMFPLTARLQRTFTRRVALALVAAVLFCIAPLGLGFTFYGILSRPQVPALVRVGAPLMISHASGGPPNVSNFPPTPPVNNSLSLVSQPLILFSGSPSPQPHRHPPPHKHGHKHKQHEHDDESPEPDDT